MLPIGNRPVIHFILREAMEAGCEPIVVIGSPDDQPLKTYVNEFEENDTLLWTQQPEPRGLAHALTKGYEVLEAPSRVVMLLPDNVAVDGNPVRTLLTEGVSRDVLQFGTVNVTPEQAPFFGNSGGYEGESTCQYGPGVEILHRLQPKRPGTFERQLRRGRNHRTVGRVLLPEEFFQRARGAEPDPESGEIDDVPIYRAMIQSSFALGIRLSSKIHDMGEPERYLRLCARVHETGISHS